MTEDAMLLKKKILMMQQTQNRTLGAEDVTVRRIRARGPSSTLVGGARRREPREPIIISDTDPTDALIMFDSNPTDGIIIIEP